ncbi:Acidic nuclear phosphoprotein 32 family member B, variant 3 [Balamuthia mandrillaris]
MIRLCGGIAALLFNPFADFIPSKRPSSASLWQARSLEIAALLLIILRILDSFLNFDGILRLFSYYSLQAFHPTACSVMVALYCLAFVAALKRHKPSLRLYVVCLFLSFFLGALSLLMLGIVVAKEGGDVEKEHPEDTPPSLFIFSVLSSSVCLLLEVAKTALSTTLYCAFKLLSVEKLYFAQRLPSRMDFVEDEEDEEENERAYQRQRESRTYFGEEDEEDGERAREEFVAGAFAFSGRQVFLEEEDKELDDEEDFDEEEEEEEEEEDRRQMRREDKSKGKELEHAHDDEEKEELL